MSLVLIAGSGAEHLADEIGGVLGVPPIAINADNSDGETTLHIDSNVRMRDTYIISCRGDSVNEHLIELSLLISALRRANAERITAVLPYFSYARQARKHMSRVPISAADVASLLEEMGVDGVIVLDLHKPEISGFFSPRRYFVTDSCMPSAARYLWSQRRLRRPVVVAPHASGVRLAQAFLDSLLTLHEAHGRPPEERPTLAMLLPHKTYVAGEGSERIQRRTLELIGVVDGHDAIVIDDIFDTGKTLTRSTEALLGHGASRIFGVATHGIFSGTALNDFANSRLTTAVVTNSIPFHIPRDHPVRKKLVVLSVAPVLAHQIAKLAGMPAPALDPMAATFPMAGAMFTGPDRPSRARARAGISTVVSPIRERVQAISMGEYDREMGVSAVADLGNISDEAEMGSDSSGEEMANNDDLDAWMAEQQRQRERERARGASDISTLSFA
jgi:ribose-phosphate pyrophosphokinase